MAHPSPARRIAILTSGGDSAGMNAAVRAIARYGLVRGCELFIVREGWQGLVSGDSGGVYESKRHEDSDICSVSDIPSQYFEIGSQPPGSTHYRQGGRRGRSVVEPVRSAAPFLSTPGDSLMLHSSGPTTAGICDKSQAQQESDGNAAKSSSYIVPVHWDDLRSFLSEGGTLIGTARCAEFRERRGRLKAARNLVLRGISALVVIGGDGSLTGADILRREWPDLLKELAETAANESEKRLVEQSLQAGMYIVGLVGSIDNDMAMTDMTIGASTALQRICEAIDSISSTASSHSRAFVIEVMGRHCGWLAVMAGVATGADYIFVPERPPVVTKPGGTWEDEMCAHLGRHRSLGKRKTIVIIAEGAIDRELNAIKADYVKEVLTSRLGLDTRVTQLGHTQRGGKPCATDRVLATMQGVEAVDAILEATPTTPSYMIGTRENKVIRVELMEAVKMTQTLARAIEHKDFEKALSLRDSEFADSLEAFWATSTVSHAQLLPAEQRLRIGIVSVGAPAGGQNAAVRTVVRYALARGHTPVGIFNGFVGLVQNNVEELGWLRVDAWTTRGGSELGTNRVTPQQVLGGMKAFAEALSRHKLDCVFITGGYEAFQSLYEIHRSKDQADFAHLKCLRVPMVVLPATISNNVPCTEFSIGSDTSLNAIMDACDAIKQSATASRNRVFVVEVQGGRCGYSAVMAGLAVGATVVYTPEDSIRLEMLTKDVDFLRRRYSADKPGGSEGRLVIRNEKASSVYTTQVLTDILREEGCVTVQTDEGLCKKEVLFDSRSAILGHLQQGGTPSPLDRTRATRFAVKCIEHLEEMSSSNDPYARNATLITIKGGKLAFVDVEVVAEQSDSKNRTGKQVWWDRHAWVGKTIMGRGDDGFGVAFQEPDGAKDRHI